MVLSGLSGARCQYVLLLVFWEGGDYSFGKIVLCSGVLRFKMRCEFYCVGGWDPQYFDVRNGPVYRLVMRGGDKAWGVDEAFYRGLLEFAFYVSSVASFTLVYQGDYLYGMLRGVGVLLLSLGLVRFLRSWGWALFTCFYRRLFLLDVRGCFLGFCRG